MLAPGRPKLAPLPKRGLCYAFSHTYLRLRIDPSSRRSASAALLSINCLSFPLTISAFNFYGFLFSTEVNTLFYSTIPSHPIQSL
jgi:hypothetical protein